MTKQHCWQFDRANLGVAQMRLFGTSESFSEFNLRSNTLRELPSTPSALLSALEPYRFLSITREPNALAAKTLGFNCWNLFDRRKASVKDMRLWPPQWSPKDNRVQNMAWSSRPAADAREPLYPTPAVLAAVASMGRRAGAEAEAAPPAAAAAAAASPLLDGETVVEVQDQLDNMEHGEFVMPSHLLVALANAGASPPAAASSAASSSAAIASSQPAAASSAASSSAAVAPYLVVPPVPHRLPPPPCVATPARPPHPHARSSSPQSVKRSLTALYLGIVGAAATATSGARTTRHRGRRTPNTMWLHTSPLFEQPRSRAASDDAAHSDNGSDSDVSVQ